MSKGGLIKKIFNGDILVTKGLKNEIPFILLICLLIVLIIAWSLFVESTLAREERLEREVGTLKIEYTHKDLELTGFNQRTKIEKMLEDCGSDLHAPEQPARLIKMEKQR
ncbi:MAG: hypothetical protein LKK19_04735 [Bacteroidales bacterium]|jgi:Tfp pilus assembly protein PilO|nr:hypothetical protein [Bacteroidales bacterium]MCI2121989.1 hypothetical protein [Bacteroidales bacterium]MCI2145574.1 hypothetical protein [Bacteroidales bacterium]